MNYAEKHVLEMVRDALRVAIDENKTDMIGWSVKDIVRDIIEYHADFEGMEEAELLPVVEKVMAERNMVN